MAKYSSKVAKYQIRIVIKAMDDDQHDNVALGLKF